MQVRARGIDELPTPAGPDPLVSTQWLRQHLDDRGLRFVHVSPDRSIYDKDHIPKAVYGDLHSELAVRGQAPSTGKVDREWLVPDRTRLKATLRRWGIGPDDRVIFYDDVGQNRQAIRGYWLLRYHGWPRDRVHVLDGGLKAWQQGGGQTTNLVAPVPEVEPVQLGQREASLIALAEQVEAWSRESAGGGPIRLLDVRTPEEYRGDDAKAKRGGHIPGAVNLPFTEFLAPDGRLKPIHELRELADEAAGGDASTIRATYCQGGVRAALAWFVLHELLGIEGVRNYAGSWEEWGNRRELPVTKGDKPG